MGQRAERIYGRKNFFELYAVFSSPALYRVLTLGGRDLDSLEQDLVDRLVEQMSSFLLGGRPWTGERVHHGDRPVTVVEAPGGQKPSWGGGEGLLVGCEKDGGVAGAGRGRLTTRLCAPPASDFS